MQKLNSLYAKSFESIENFSFSITLLNTDTPTDNHSKDLFSDQKSNKSKTRAVML